MNQYELTLVFRSNVESEQRNEILERLKGYIQAGNDTPAEIAVKEWGKRQLAYPIKKEYEGYYVFIECNMAPQAVSNLERNILYTDQILRHLVVRRGS